MPKHKKEKMTTASSMDANERRVDLEARPTTVVVGRKKGTSEKQRMVY